MNLSKIRTILRLHDTLIADEILSRQETILGDVLRDLGCPNPVFERYTSGYGLSSTSNHYSWNTGEWLDYETAILHPWAEVSSAKTLCIYGRIAETVDGVLLSTSITVEVTIPEDARETLRNIGKITLETTPAEYSEVLACNH